VEREILLTGIGGQGIQLASQVLAEAALAEGRDVQLFGAYGGMMRGGSTEATVVVADDAIEAPPTVGSAWAGLVMHHDYAASTLERVRAGGLVLLNSSVWEGPLDRARFQVVDAPATDLAVDAGNVLAAGMVMLGALVGATRAVSLGSLVDALARCIPPYRRQHVDVSTRAIELGADYVQEVVAEAWPSAAAEPVVSS
jgi:Pyruvate/2-oxoacid:ferredoxin oxidoreductase gamma subunit